MSNPPLIPHAQGQNDDEATIRDVGLIDLFAVHIAAARISREGQPLGDTYRMVWSGEVYSLAADLIRARDNCSAIDG